MSSRNVVVSPSAGDILSGADAKIVELRRDVKSAKRVADRQTARAKEAQRRLRESEASLQLQAENKRIRARVADLLIVIGEYANGNHELGNRLAQIVAPTAGKLATHFDHDPDALVRGIAEREELRGRYLVDSHGHRVRADQVDANNECAECKRENRRIARNAAKTA